jgi:pyridoxamine 5'-phosphate oxidase family protein
MRAIGFVLALILALCVAYGAYMAAGAVLSRREARQHQRARWQMTHHVDDGETVVAVSQVRPDGRLLASHEVARIPDGAPDWNERFLAATQTAEERAYHLNAAG